MTLLFPDERTISAAFAVALGVGLLFAWPVYAFLLRINSRQTVSEFLGESHQKKQGTPTMGGLIILPGFVIASACVGLDWRVLGLFLGFAAIGFVDDYLVPCLWAGKRGLGWLPKLALEVAVVALCLTPPPQIGYGWTYLGWMFVVLFFANAYNFADGLDGLAGGLLLIIAAVLLLFCREGQCAYMCAALCGAVIPFLFLNSPPAKVFMGDVGSLPIGAMLGLVVVAILFPVRMGMLGMSDRRQLWEGLGILVLSLVLIAELVPVPLQILSVKLRKGKRLFPRTPIHHTFEYWGWPESKITWTFLLAQLVCAGLAISIAVWGVGRLTPSP